MGEPTAARTRGLLRRLGIVGPAMPLVVFGLSSLLAQWDDSALGVLLPDMRAEFGLNLQFLVSLNAALGILGLVLALPFGYAADRIRRVWLLRGGSIVANAGSIVQGVAPGVGALVAGRIVAGAGTAAVPPASFSFLADSYPPSQRSRVFALTYVAGQSGIIIGPIVAGLLGARFGWRTAVVVLGVLATGVSLLTFALREPKRGGAESEDARRLPPLSPVESWRTAFGIGTVRRLCIATPFMTAKGAATGLLTIYFADTFVLGAGPRGLILALYGAVGLIGLVVAAPFADRILSERPGAFFTLAGGLLAAQALALVVLAVSSNLIVSIAASVPIATVDVIFAPAFLALVSQVVPPRVRGLGLQVTAPFQLVGYALSIIIVGAIGANGLHSGMAVFALPTIAGALILGTGATVVGRDLRTARAQAGVATAVSDAPSPLLAIRDLEAGYGGVPVLFGVDLDVAPGEIVALLGTNGAGKSTLLRAIAGLQPVTTGAINFDRTDLGIVPASRRAELGIHLLAGGHTTFDDLTVAEHLALVDGHLDAAMAAVPGLADQLDRRGGDLSGGEQQRLAVALAVLAQPRLLLIDELSLGLAPSVVSALLDTLRQLRANGTTILLVEQSLNVALTIADRALFLERGEVRFDGPVGDLLDRPDLVRATFLGPGRASRARPARRDRPESSREGAVDALRAEAIGVAFGGVTALDGVDLAVRPAEIIGIIGPNGAGKTTLFDVLSGFVEPATGRVILAGDDVTDEAPDGRARRGLARSFQRARLFPALSVRENVMAAMRGSTASNPLAAALSLPSHRSRESKLAQRADELLELLDLQARAEDAVAVLSTGTRRVVDVACILAARPRVLLMDEPSSGLAQAEVEALGPLLVRIVRETGCGLIAIEHDLPLISAVADRLVAMDLGRVIAQGTPAQVRADPAVLSTYLAASDAVIARSGPRKD